MEHKFYQCQLRMTSQKRRCPTSNYDLDARQLPPQRRRLLGAAPEAARAARQGRRAMKTTNDAMQRIDPILNEGWWMSLTSPWRNGDYWFCGLTPKGATGRNGRPDIEASGKTAPEAIENCCEKWDEWHTRANESQSRP